MGGNKINLIPAVFEHGAVPMQVAGDASEAGTAGNGLDGFVEALHHDRRLLGAAGVLVCGDVTGLPDTVHFVAKAPEFDAVGIGMTVGFSLVGPIGSGGEVAVFDQLAGGLGPFGAEVDSHHRLGLSNLAPGHKLVGAELIGLPASPCVIRAHGAIGFGANSIAPVVTADEISAGVSHHRHFQRHQQIQNVFAKTLLIAEGIARVIDALINSAAKMFQKPTENSAVNLACMMMRIEMNGGLHERCSLP